MGVIKEKDLFDICLKHDISAFQIKEFLNCSDFILLSSPKVEEILRLMKVENLKSLFYSYEYYEDKEYILSRDDIEELNQSSIQEEEKEELRTLMELQLQHIDKQTFEKPKVLCLYTLLQGEYLLLEMVDEWLDELIIKHGFKTKDEYHKRMQVDES